MAWNLIIILHLSHTHLFFMKWESAFVRLFVCLYGWWSNERKPREIETVFRRHIKERRQTKEYIACRWGNQHANDLRRIEWNARRTKVENRKKTKEEKIEIRICVKSSVKQARATKKNACACVSIADAMRFRNLSAPVSSMANLSQHVHEMNVRVMRMERLQPVACCMWLRDDFFFHIFFRRRQQQPASISALAQII